MARNQNPKSFLFLYEGYTEKEFYDKIFDAYLPKRKIRIHKYNLKGIGNNLNKKVRRRIHGFLTDKRKTQETEVYIIIAYDREGTRAIDTLLNIDKLRTEFITQKKSRIKGISEIVATQDLESWFFHDMNGIYNYLKVPKKSRTLVISDVEKTNNRVLAQLFRKHNRIYQKRGKACAGFIASLDLDMIYRKSTDLKKAIADMIKIMAR